MAGSSSKASTKRSAASSSSASGSKSKKPKPTPSTSEDATLPLGKALASTEKRTRDFAIRSLHSYLSTNGAHTIPPLELQKLWKGLFYCFWMSDKPLIQQRLANDLAALVLVHPSSSAPSTSESAMSSRAEAGLAFLEGFWDTLVSEWSGLDKHRIDKYYLLVRRFVAAGFRLLAEEKWSPAAVARFGRIMGKFEGGVLSTNDPRVPDSLTYHLSDIYLDELEKVLQLNDGTEEKEEVEEEEEEEELALVPTLELLKPFVDALATAKSKAMYERIWGNIFSPLLEDTLRAAARVEDSEDEEEEEQEEDEEESEEEEEGGDETANGTEFHSFADESELPPADESEGESEDEEESDAEEEDGEDVKFPLLLALSAVPTPTPTDVEEEEVEEVDVALLLRKAIFQALFTAASRKDATEARRRLLYQLWRDEQDRLNDLQGDE